MRSIPILAMLPFVLVLACTPSKFKGDAAKKAAADDAPTPSPLSPNTASTIDGLKAACAAAAASLKTDIQVLHFPERDVCNWNVAPNLDKINQSVQASETTVDNLKLPDGKICDISVDSPKDLSFHYDDLLILTIDQKVVYLSNKLLADKLTQQDGIYTWDFTKVVGMHLDDFDGVPLCLGNTNECSFPTTDIQGPVTIKLPSEKVAPIAVAINGKGSVPVNLTATGDNDDRDCYHTNLDLTFTVRYLGN